MAAAGPRAKAEPDGLQATGGLVAVAFGDGLGHRRPFAVIVRRSGAWARCQAGRVEMVLPPHWLQGGGWIGSDASDLQCLSSPHHEFVEPRLGGLDDFRVHRLDQPVDRRIFDRFEDPVPDA